MATTRPKKYRVAQPKRMNGSDKGIDLLTRDEIMELRRQIANQIIGGINSIFNPNGQANVGALVIMWDIAKPDGAVTYCANQPREVGIQVMTKFRERSEARQEPSQETTEPEAQS